MSTKDEQFKVQRMNQISKNEQNLQFKKISMDWINSSAQSKYAYNFEWLGRPIIQFPQDIIEAQELIWKVKPDLIIETGIAHGGSIIFSASMLALLDQADNLKNDKNKTGIRRKVLGIDIDIREHNLKAIKEHPFYSYIDMIEGSSITNSTINKVENFAKGFDNIMVFLDSNHTHDHVLEELHAYAPLTSKGSYCVVFDTIIEDMPKDSFPNRPWGKNNNPKTAVWKFLKENSDFEIDKSIQNKLMITVAPDGYLKKVK